jgi:BirA family biotin operon repressor/biotin-[acetyl-CoA-carboxylase] ligase
MKGLLRNNFKNPTYNSYCMHKIHHFKSLTSTQDKAKEFASKGFSNVVIVADIQTKGRGRFKRKWHSSMDGLWMSILLKPKNIERLQYLTFIASISVVRSIKKISGLKTSIKWPNDVHYKAKKLCGILTEGIFGKENFVAVGIGLNVNQAEFPNEIKDIAASLRILKHRNFNVERVRQIILDEFFGLYSNHYNKNKFDEIAKIWKRYCDTIGKEVIATTKTRKINGRAIGIDKDCNLLVKLKNSKIAKVIEGDVTVRHRQLR